MRGCVNILLRNGSRIQRNGIDACMSKLLIVWSGVYSFLDYVGQLLRADVLSLATTARAHLKSNPNLDLCVSTFPLVQKKYTKSSNKLKKHPATYVKNAEPMIPVPSKSVDGSGPYVVNTLNSTELVRIVTTQAVFLNNIKSLRHSSARIEIRDNKGWLVENQGIPTLVLTEDHLDPFFLNHLGDLGQDWDLVHIKTGQDCGIAVRSFLLRNKALR